MKKTISGLILGLLLCSFSPWSQSEELAILPLKYRLPEEVLPTLRPFLAEGATLQADNNLIIVRTNEQNLAQLKVILAQVDKPLQQLMITVKQLNAREAARFRASLRPSPRASKSTSGLIAPRRGIEAPGFLGPDPDQAIVRLGGTRTRKQGSNTQRVRVLEGRAARIQAGHSIPLADRAWLPHRGQLLAQNSIRYQDVTSGFEVLPRTNGDKVILEIRPYQAHPSSQGGGRIAMQALTTQVSVPLGQWFELGGADEVRQQQERGAFYGTHSRKEELRHIFIHVDKVK